MSQSGTTPSLSLSLQRGISTKSEYHFRMPSRRIENSVRAADCGKRMKEVERVEGERRGRRECYWIVTKATDQVEGAKSRELDCLPGRQISAVSGGGKGQGREEGS